MKVGMVDALVGNDYSLLLCSHLQALGVEVCLITTEDRSIPNGISFPVFRWAPPKSASLRRSRKMWDYFRYLGRLTGSILRKEFDVFHFQFFRRERPEALLLGLLGRLGVRWVMTAHNILPHESSAIDHLLRRMLYKKARCLIVHSHWMSQKLSRGFGVPMSRIHVVPHGDFASYRPSSRLSKKEARKRLGLSTHEAVLLFFGYIREYKGLDTLLEAFETLFREKPSVKLTIAGQCRTQQLEQRYRQIIQGMKSRPRIVFRPGFVPVEEVPLYLLATDLVVLPYRRIDHSGILHLAYTFGRAVLATDVGDLGGMIREDRTGWVVRPGDADALVTGLLEALSDRKRLQALGARARRLSATKYSWKLSARLTVEAYGRLLAAGERPHA